MSQTHDSQIEFAQFQAQRIKDLFPEYNKAGTTIFDFGCGTGVMTTYLQEVFFNARVIGIDHLKEAIEKAQESYPELEFQEMEDSQLPCQSESVDLVVASQVFHHIPTNQHEQYIQEIYRVLKPNGRFVLLELNPYNFWTKRAFQNNPIEKDVQMLSPFQARKILKIVRSISIRFYCFFPEWIPLGWVEPWLSRIPFGGLYVMSAQK